MTEIRKPTADDFAPDDAPTEEELREARAFSERFESGGAGELEDLARGIAALAPDDSVTRARVETIARQAAARAAAASVPARGRVIAFRRATVVVSATLALAAGALFMLRAEKGPAAAPSLIAQRSTQPLFTAPFSQQPPSARIDRIVTARMGDLRENRFRLAMAGTRERSR